MPRGLDTSGWSEVPLVDVHRGTPPRIRLVTRHSVRRLDNSRWGFDSNCFVCEPRNDAGLRIPFDHDLEAGVVRAAFSLDQRFSGAPAYVHGGVTLAILDEAMAWAAIAIGGRFAVTGESSARFLHPVRVGREYTVEARIAGGDEQRLDAVALIQDDRGRPCVEGDATLVILAPAQATDAIGTTVAGPAASFLRDA